MLHTGNEGNVLESQAKAPGSVERERPVVAADAAIKAGVVTEYAGEPRLGIKEGDAPGTVLQVAVIAGGIPAEDARRHPVELVFHQRLC